MTIRPQSGHRVDGLVKVTGRARYAGDVAAEGVVFGCFATSDIPAGKVTSVDTTDAEAEPGVVRIWTHENVPRLPKLTHAAAGESLLPLQTDRVTFEGQGIALVLAETLEAAEEAARRVRATYEVEPAQTDFRMALDQRVVIDDWAPLSTSVGDFAAGLGRAQVKVDQSYRTADRHHHAIEPAAVLAIWDGREMLVHDSTQWGYGVRAALAQVLGLPPTQIRVVSEYVGGGFGAKGSVWPYEVYAAVAARELGRPVKIVLSRSQSFTAHGYQPATDQRVILGATEDGCLTAVRHESINPTAILDDHIEHGTLGTRSMYQCPAIETQEHVVRVHRGSPTFMRTPHEGPGMVGLEIAMDELAYALHLDPLELRRRNYAEHDPTNGKPFSSNALRECYDIGAERFGWARRTHPPKSMRDGNDWVGWGMGNALMGTFRFGASARTTLTRDGRVRIETGSQEIGTGTRTTLPLVAAEILGIPADRITVSLGDTNLPEAGGTFGSSTTIGVGSAVREAATQLRHRLNQLAAEPGLQPHEYGEVLALRGLDQLAAEGGWAPSKESGNFAMFAFGAVFAEVRVDALLRVPRVTRLVGAYSVGRVIDPIGARAQITGGMIWGIGQALMESSTMDHALGRYVSKNLTGGLVPVSADVPDLEVHFADEFDPHASPLGARGVGEIGPVGVAPAIANAVFHATGIRIREVPIRVEHLMGEG